MFNLIRRISNGVILRPDRPWADDATSNAPSKGKKRRLERGPDVEPTETRTKKIRGESDAPETQTSTPQPEPTSVSASVSELEPERQKQEEQDVKEVTKGVKEVELNESRSSTATSKEGQEVKPESVPLPGEDDVEELQGVDASLPPEVELDDISSSVDGEGEADELSESEPRGQEVKGSQGEGVGEKKVEESDVPEPETKTTESAAPAQPAH
ncbi:hypothetical protein C0995_012404 [Termitomyces sp. Mi166|nr:hypothetical protein C0995_012404 [Termitomyces sp. Mi166\